MNNKNEDMQNTLDFYNDDMSRKAVGKLFSREEIKNVYTDDEETNELVDSYRKKSMKNKELLNDTFGEIDSTLDFEEEAEEEFCYEPSTPPSLKIPFIVIIFIFLILTGGLVLKINSTDAQLKTAKKSLEENFAKLDILTSLETENEELKTQVVQLKKELETFAIAGFEVETKELEDTTQLQPEIKPTEPSSKQTTYVVEKSDNLSKISKKFYGTANDFQKIIEVNNLKSDNIVEGQVLIIPE